MVEIGDTLGALLLFFALDFTIQWVSCVFSSILQTEIFFDLMGSFTFLLASCGSLALGGVFHQRQVMATTLVAVWAMRLGTFLFMRILQAGKDSRFDGVRTDPVMFFAFWTIQGVWVFVVLLPVIALNVSLANEDWLQVSDALGLVLWAVGFLFEAVADYQKFFFRLEDGNKDKWVSTGLWSLSRHPNYFGEIVLWWGMYFLCFAGLNSLPLKALGLASPLFTMLMLMWISGIPLLERAADRKWGSKIEYLNYLNDTPCLIPRIFPKKQRAHAD